MSAYLRLILRNALRNRRRTLLTGTSVAVSIFLLVSLDTLLTELRGETLLSQQSARRLLTRSSVSLAIPLPVAYKEKIRQIPEVDMVSEYQWIPTYYKEPRNSVVIIAVDPVGIGTDPEVFCAKKDMDAFRADRQAVLVPVKMLRKFGWRIGDRVTFPATVFPFDLQLTIRGTFTATVQNVLFCHFSLFNERARQAINGRPDQTMAFILRATSPQIAPQIAATIDSLFSNSSAPTRTESEKSFVLGFSEMLGNVRVFISLIAAAVIFAIALVTTNTMAMAVRERTHEIAMLKTLGFTPATVLFLIVGESLFIAAVGGVAGAVTARAFFKAFDIYDLTNGVIQHFQITGDTMVRGLALAVAMSIVSSIVPAWRGSSRPIAASLRDI